MTRIRFGILLAFGLLLVALVTACNDEVKDITPTKVLGSQENASAPAPPTPTQAPTTIPASPTPLPSPKRIGEPSSFQGRDGAKFSITANALTENAHSSNQFNKPMGRWVLVDWSIKNEGSANVDISTSSLKLLTSEGFEISQGNHAGFPEPDFLGYPTLGPGQMLRGYAVYDVPSGATLKAAIYHPSGSPQLSIVDIAPTNGGGSARCADGTTSQSSGPGTCSDHGGIAP